LKEISRINHVGLRVRNLETARAFYEELGFEFIVGPVGPEPVAVMEHPSGININFILNASDDASPDNLLMDVPQKHTGFTHIGWCRVVGGNSLAALSEQVIVGLVRRRGQGWLVGLAEPRSPIH
jgi:catechol 2,3-dioxygenase-like lactoylglutathione lyase family enzyme